MVSLIVVIFMIFLNYENGRLEKLVRYNLPNNIIDYRYFADDKNYKLNEFTPINVNGKFITPATDACYNMVFDVSNDSSYYSHIYKNKEGFKKIGNIINNYNKGLDIDISNVIDVSFHPFDLSINKINSGNYKDLYKWIIFKLPFNDLVLYDYNVYLKKNSFIVKKKDSIRKTNNLGVSVYVNRGNIQFELQEDINEDDEITIEIDSNLIRFNENVENDFNELKLNIKTYDKIGIYLIPVKNIIPNDNNNYYDIIVTEEGRNLNLTFHRPLQAKQIIEIEIDIEYLEISNNNDITESKDNIIEKMNSSTYYVECVNTTNRTKQITMINTLPIIFDDSLNSLYFELSNYQVNNYATLEFQFESNIDYENDILINITNVEYDNSFVFFNYNNNKITKKIIQIILI